MWALCIYNLYVYTYKYRRAYSQEFFHLITIALKHNLLKAIFQQHTHPCTSSLHHIDTSRKIFFTFSKTMINTFFNAFILYLHLPIVRTILPRQLYYQRYSLFSFFFPRKLTFSQARGCVTGWKGLVEVTCVLYNTIYCHSLLDPNFLLFFV